MKISIVEYGTKPADQFMVNPRNPRRHPKNQREAVADSLGRVGFIAPVIENRQTGHLLDGHERVWQALQEDNADVPYVVVDVAEADEAYVLATFDPMTALAEIDAEAFAELLKEVQTDSQAVQEMLAEQATASLKELGELGVVTNLAPSDIEGWGALSERVIIVFADAEERAAFWQRLGVAERPGQVMYEWASLNA